MKLIFLIEKFAINAIDFMNPNSWNNVECELFGGNHTLDAILLLLEDEAILEETKTLFRNRECVVYYDLTDNEMLMVM